MMACAANTLHPSRAAALRTQHVPVGWCLASIFEGEPHGLADINMGLPCSNSLRTLCQGELSALLE
eukprot:CAMPEP_0174744614 /NCGR_PEP_ID=MMETSP1094-20130205/84834_1 /TAXON_ID=156173 /ORGANISM="Chrysochromulina brevifilum, Strain UTEX LB 985" /LENGTH=65 /DNA_ID=CAMNT_0015949037 /DNA_START=227 /DNA_END=421 /DNA_ORIENTATION=-